MDFNNISNIAKSMGMSEEELASLILAKEQEGWSNQEIADLLVTNLANKEYAAKGQEEVDDLLGLGFNPDKSYNPDIPKGGKQGYKEFEEPEDVEESNEPSWLSKVGNWIKEKSAEEEERKAREREAIANSWNDYRDRTDPWFRVGLVNAIYGDNSMLNGYYNAMNQNAQNERNREAQNEYNNYWKEIERQDKLKAEANEKAKKLQNAKVEYAKMLKELQTAGPADQVIINAQIKQLLKEYPEIDNAVEVDGNMVNPMLAKASQAAEEEREYQKKLADFTSKLPTSFKTDPEKTNKIAEVMSDDTIRDADKLAIVKELRAIKSQQQISAEAKAGAVASEGAKGITNKGDKERELETLLALPVKKPADKLRIKQLKKELGK